MVDHPEWGSKADPRRIAAAYDERNSAPRSVSFSLDAFCSQMPAEVKDRVLVNRRIKQVHDQFATVVDPFILEHTNSVYLLKSQSMEGAYDLVVYLDNSTCAAELNARRELIRLKYLEQFSVKVDVFEIRISRGRYKNKHPFKKYEEASGDTPLRRLTQQEEQGIDEALGELPEGRMKESFRKAMTALKRRENENS